MMYGRMHACMHTCQFMSLDACARLWPFQMAGVHAVSGPVIDRDWAHLSFNH